MTHNRQLDRIERKIDISLRKHDAILRWAIYLARKLHTMAADLTEITAQVTATRDAEDAAVVLLTELKSRLDAAGTDPVALKALSDQLGAGKDALAQAIVANTPAESPPSDPGPPPFEEPPAA